MRQALLFSSYICKNTQASLLKPTCLLFPRGAVPNLCTAVACSVRSDNNESVDRRGHLPTGSPMASCHSCPHETAGRRRRISREKTLLSLFIAVVSCRATSQAGRPAAGTINRSMGVTGGHSQRSTDSRPSSETHSSHLGHSPLLPLRNLNGSIYR